MIKQKKMWILFFHTQNTWWYLIENDATLIYALHKSKQHTHIMMLVEYVFVVGQIIMLVIYGTDITVRAVGGLGFVMIFGNQMKKNSNITIGHGPYVISSYSICA